MISKPYDANAVNAAKAQYNVKPISKIFALLVIKFILIKYSPPISSKKLILFTLVNVSFKSLKTPNFL